MKGDTVFRFYDTYGIPLEVIEEIAGDEGVSIDRHAFDALLDQQRLRSKVASNMSLDEEVEWFSKLELPPRHSEFRGYPELDSAASRERTSSVCCGMERPSRSSPRARPATRSRTEPSSIPRAEARSATRANGLGQPGVRKCRTHRSRFPA